MRVVVSCAAPADAVGEVGFVELEKVFLECGVELGLILFDGQHVVTATGHDLSRDLLLA
jgi:hypothetical protein